MLIQFCEAVDLVRRHVESGIDHSERTKDPLLQKVFKGHIGKHLHEIATDISRDTIIPGAAGMEPQRKICHPGDLLFQRGGLAAKDRFTVHFVNWRVKVKAVTQARGMGEQVMDRHRRVRRNEMLPHVTIAAQHLSLSEGGDVSADGFRELELALLIQHHQGDRCDRLSHAVDAEDGVALHRQHFLRIAETTGLKMHHFRIPRDQRDEAGHFLAVNIFLQPAVDIVQPLR